MLRRSFSPLITILLAALVLGGIPGTARASSSTVAYQYLIGVDGLIGPDRAQAPDGQTIEMTGEGDFTVHPKVLVSGGGDYVLKDPGGSIVESGSWSATQFISFVSYGSFPAPFPPTFEGGKALFQIHLSPSSGGPGADGVLKVTCIGGSPPPGDDEGVQLALQGSPNFNRNFGEFESGQTLFIRTSPP